MDLFTCVLQAASEEVANPTVWEWVKLLGGILMTPGFIGLVYYAYKAHKRGQLGKFLYQSIEEFKRERADDGDPDSAKALTRRIGAKLDDRGDLKSEHERLLKAAGANLTSILGPVIARMAQGGTKGA